MKALPVHHESAAKLRRAAGLCNDGLVIQYFVTHVSAQNSNSQVIVMSGSVLSDMFLFAHFHHFFGLAALLMIRWTRI